VGAGDIAVVSKMSETKTSDTLCDRTHAIRYDGISASEPMYTVAVSAKTKSDEDKLGAALHRLEDENPWFRLGRDTETGETHIAAAGETHVDVLVERLKRFGATVEIAAPRVPYRETIQAQARAEGKHKKQSGGHGQFGDCWIEIEPIERGGGFIFVDAVVGGAIPKQYIPAVKAGIADAMARGVVAGYPVVDLKATVYDGKFHEVDSSEAAFKIAGSLAFQNAVALARPVLLEPVFRVGVAVPEDCMGDVMSDLNTKRGRMLGMDRVVGVDGSVKQRVNATVPQAELARYAIDLRSLSHGRGSYTAEFSHYEEMPHVIERDVVNEAVKNGFSLHVEH